MTVSETTLVEARIRTTWLEWALLILVVLSLAALVVIAKELQDSRTFSLRNRATFCDGAQLAFGTEPLECSDPALKPYRDPTVVKGRRTSLSVEDRRILCALAAAQKLRVAECVRR